MNGTAMTSPVPWRLYDSADALAAALADEVEVRLREALSLRKQAHLVVSGGATPYPFFAALKNKPLPWPQIHIALTDERCVPISHEDSNENMLRERLLMPDSTFVSLAAHVHETSEQAIARITPKLRAMVPFDVLVLGMGVDGHVASLFPDNAALASCDDALLLAVDDAPKAPPRRISMTPKTLLNTRQLFLHITGEGKRDMYEKAIQSGDPVRYPVAAFLQQQTTPITVYWSP